jgi:hypothetical protein
MDAEVRQEKTAQGILGDALSGLPVGRVTGLSDLVQRPRRQP